MKSLHAIKTWLFLGLCNSIVHMVFASTICFQAMVNGNTGTATVRGSRTLTGPSPSGFKN